jgi:acetylornithine deacetylase/succinyl-diaminopimelate desuccinylase-like protein
VSVGADAVLRRTIELARIPAPTGEEATRAILVRSWWEHDGLLEVRTDDVGNVWGKVRGGDGPIVVVAAHLDTVFGADVAHTPDLRGDRLVGPSVGDDAVAVAALSSAGLSVGDGPSPVWLLATVGEEGLGNLRGAHAALDAPPGDVAAFIAVEGNYLGRVSTVGVGSVRRRVCVRGPGGHAWEAADAPSAVHAVADMASSIAGIRRRPGTSINVGRIGGGEGINVRAREAWFEVDIRAEEPEALRLLAEQVEAMTADVDDGLSVEHEVLGDRPAGRLDDGHALARAATDALAEAEIAVTSPPTSTDANAAHARGIPAIAIGVTRGSGEHTGDEWIEVDPIEQGVRVLARTIDRYEELST